MDKQYYEEARWLKVYDECELLIIGSGAAGHSAAIAAARAGCRNIILMDRYGYSGGDVTGGYVIMVKGSAGGVVPAHEAHPRCRARPGGRPNGQHRSPSLR